MQNVSSKNILTKVSFATFTDTFQSHKVNGCDGDFLAIICPLQYEVTTWIIKLRKYSSLFQILIQTVNYRGLSSNTTDCPDEFKNTVMEEDVSECDVEEVKYLIKEKCEGENNCMIQAIADNLPDPCPSVRSVLRKKLL